MTEPVLVDTGPIYALIDQDDEFHDECAATFRLIRGPAMTCWPVVTEAAWLLREDHRKIKQLLDIVAEGTLRQAPLDAAAASWIGEFLTQYRNLPAQLADAALMYLAEAHDIRCVFTLDRRDFTVYRTSDGSALRLIPDF